MMNLDKKLLTSIISAAALGFGAGHIAQLPPAHVTVHAVDLRVRSLPDGGTELERQAWGHRGATDVGPGKCPALTADSSAHAAQVVTDAENTCTWP